MAVEEAELAVTMAVEEAELETQAEEADHHGGPPSLPRLAIIQ